MPGKKLTALTAIMVVVVSLTLAGCGQARTPRQGEPSAPAGGGAAADKAGTGQVKTLEVAGLTLAVPETHLLWPAQMPKDDRPPRYGGSLTHPFPGDAPSIDPSLTSSYLRNRIATLAYDRLVMWDREPGANPYSIKLVPGLAESWSISSDGLTYTFKLRKGVKFAPVEPVNGREFTAQDVLFSYQYFTRDESVMKSGFPDVAKVDAPDPYTVVYTLKQRRAGFLSEISSNGIGLILPKEVAARDGDLKKAAIGTGPFYNTDGWQPKVGIELKRNPNYWVKDAQGNGLPYIDNYIIRVVPDHSARQTAFRTGKLDWGSEFPLLTEIRSLQKTNPQVYGQEFYSPTGGSGYMMRLDKAPFNDVRVRRALSLAANYRELGALIYDIPTEPQLSIVVRSHWLGEGFDTPTNLGEWYQYHPERARQLLAEAGYPNGFETTLEYFEYSKELKAIPEYLREAWAKIGVKVELKSMDYTVFRANVDTAGWQNMSHAFSFPNPLDIDTTLNFVHSKGLGIKTQGGPNDPQLDQWVEAMWASTNQQERMELLKKIRARVVDQVFIIPSVIAPTFTQIQPWVRNFQPRVSGFSDDYSSAIYAWIDEGWRK